MHEYSLDGSNERNNIHRVIAVLLVLLSFAITYLVSTLATAYPSLPALAAPSAFALWAGLKWLFDKHLWKWKRIRSLCGVKTPILTGPWKVEMRSTLDDPPETFSGEIWIEQGWSTILISFRGSDAHSRSQSATLNCFSEKEVELTYTYLSKPITQETTQKHMHYGTCQVSGEIGAGGWVNLLRGSYFTDWSRRSYGEIVHERVNPGVRIVPETPDESPTLLDAAEDWREEDKPEAKG